VASPAPVTGPRLLRDQRRAAIAYQCVAEVLKPAKGVIDAKAYKNLVLAIGVDIRRMGLSGALAAVEREKAVGELLLTHLRSAPMHARLREDQDLSTWVRRLDDLTAYMLATRELLQFIVWLRRAVQSQIKEP
jgi:CRISPR/Cas system CMR-associated protein Cmr5 small subunit